MNRKGQIISLDAVIALIIVMLSLGIAFNVMETNSYNLKEEQLFDEVVSVGKAAANLLVSHPEIICKVTFNGKEFAMNNCINTADNVITKKRLGIDGTEYECKLLLKKALTQEEISINTECNVEPTHAKNVYSEKRTVITENDGEFSKLKFEAHNFTEQEITLKVWKR